MDGPTIAMHESLPAGLVARVHRLVATATAVDGVAPLSEHVLLHLRLGGEGPDRHLLVTAGPDVAGYAHLDPTDQVAGPAVEVVVHPAHRGRGIGRRLVAAAARHAPDGRLRVWAHGDHPAARAVAARLGLHEVRRLEQWRRPLGGPLPPAPVPAGIVVRAFRPGTDDDAWLALNARAFAGHPEQGAWTARDLHLRTAESWFDPDGFLLAEEDGRLVGFHWTKVHGGPVGGGPVGGGPVDDGPVDDGATGHGHDPIGEVYVLGVDPAAQGRGLGRLLTLAGLERLRSLGLPQAMLYVESDNHAARATYRTLGFTHWGSDVMFSHHPKSG